MKAIQTQYKGHHFRSRLEARWAVFFDTLGIRWNYEPEGFEFSDGTKYLPDFFIYMRHDLRPAVQYPGAGYWVEIKGQPYTQEEYSKIQRLCISSGHHGMIMVSTPGENKPQTVSSRPHTNTPIEDQSWRQVESWLPTHLTATDWLFHGQAVSCCAAEGTSLLDVQNAVVSARSARFEYGETPV